MPVPPENPLELLPHAEPFRFLTRVTELTPGATGKAEWDLSGEEDFFRGHFPGAPVVPGVLLTEAAAQLSGLVAWSGSKSAKNARPDGVRLAQANMKFPGAATPPSTISISAEFVRELGPLCILRAEVRCADKTIAEGTITLARVTDDEEHA